MTVLIDSWAWIEYFRGSKAGERAREFIEGDEDAVVSTINLAEVYRWILRFYPEEVADEKVGAMKQRCTVIEVTERIAIESKAEAQAEARSGRCDNPGNCKRG